MNGTASGDRPPETDFRNVTEVVAWVVARVNDVPDPCSVTRGVPIGLADMGLVNGIEVRRVEDRWQVGLQIRFTSPACLFGPEFEEQIRARLATSEHIELIELQWSPDFNWSRDDIAPQARARLDRLRSDATRRRDVALDAGG